MKTLPDPPANGNSPSATGRSRVSVRQPKGCEQQERALVAALPGGRRTPGSGAPNRPSAKGDAYNNVFRAEAKTTEKKTLSVKHEWLWKIRAEAHATGRVPAFVFGFDEVKTATHLLQGREDWLAFPLSVAEAMLRTIDALDRGQLDEARLWAARTKP